MANKKKLLLTVDIQKMSTSSTVKLNFDVSVWNKMNIISNLTYLLVLVLQFLFMHDKILSSLLNLITELTIIELKYRRREEEEKNE